MRLDQSRSFHLLRRPSRSPGVGCGCGRTNLRLRSALDEEVVSENLRDGTLIVKPLAFFLFVAGKGIEEVERRAIYVHKGNRDKNKVKDCCSVGAAGREGVAGNSDLRM